MTKFSPPSKFPFSLLGTSAIGVWSIFYSDFFGLSLIVSMAVILLCAVFAFKDFFLIAQAKKVPLANGEGGEKPLGKHIDAAPLSLILLSTTSLLGTLSLLSYKEIFGLWCIIPAIIDLILIALAFRKFYHISIDKNPETAHKP